MHLSPTETASRFGVSIKALRLYEERGLLTPLRSEAGWRTYGPDQIARLHQILALKRLGLSLARIGELLAGPDSLEEVLALQEQVLARDSEQLARALALVRAARAKLKAGQTLSIDDLANLTKETVMTTPLDSGEMGALLKPFTERHLSESDRAAVKAKIPDQDQAALNWYAMLAEAYALMKTGDPTSPEAQDMARRWSAINEQITADDPTIKAKARAVWDDAMKDPAVAAKMALNREIFAFVRQAVEHFRARAK
jgi:MerR family transcriptional regulator, thiopeptide resistance regulator